ncbi:MAG: tripartite tricarboxylate transporter substrate binding protein [Rhizobiales bacterium]|nr:tripartite tricarboxylate transporter substrate binding protein [Hyphomicrobiales bacterium]
MKSLVRLLIAAAGLALSSAAAHAQGSATQAYPSKPITVIVPFGPGSATDTVARVVAQHLGAALKQSIVIENKAGANGAIAAAYVARSAPDGYTLFMSGNSPHSAAPSLNKSIAYDPVKDFAPVTRVGSFTLMLVLHPDVPAKTIPELIAHAKANPGKLSFGSGNTSGVVAGETLKVWAKIDIVHVPYRSAPQAIQDLLAGRVSLMFNDLTTGLPHVKADRLRALAVTRIQRSTLIPELPTLDEAGLKGFDMDSWAGLLAPANTPPDVVNRLNTELRTIIENPEVKAKLASVGFEAFSSTPGEFGDFVKVQLAKWGKMIKDAGVQPQ